MLWFISLFSIAYEEFLIKEVKSIQSLFIVLYNILYKIHYTKLYKKSYINYKFDPFLS